MNEFIAEEFALLIVTGKQDEAYEKYKDEIFASVLKKNEEKKVVAFKDGSVLIASGAQLLAVASGSLCDILIEQSDNIFIDHKRKPTASKH